MPTQTARFAIVRMVFVCCAGMGLLAWPASALFRAPSSTPAVEVGNDPPLTAEGIEPEQESYAYSFGELWWMSGLPNRPGTQEVVDPEAIPADPMAADSAPVDELLSILVHLDPQLDGLGAKAAEPSEVRLGLRQFAAQRGARVEFEYDIVPNLLNLRDVLRSELDEIARLPGVEKVEEDAIVSIALNDSTQHIRARQSQISGAGLCANGGGVRVCVLDTGIDSNHTMFSARIDTAAGWDYVNNDSNPEDDNGHGSHVSGIAVGRTGFNFNFGCVGSEPVQGVAPGATLIGVKVMNAGGTGQTSHIVAGINRCASTSLAGGQADVINMSIGGGLFAGICNDTLAIASNNAVNAGVVVVAAAGNNNSANGLSSPACAANVIAVGATYDDNFPSCEFPGENVFTFCTNSNCTTTCTDIGPDLDQRVCLSNRSLNLDVAAPGCLIFSADSGVPSGFGIVGNCGTSMAAPHVAGLAALILDADPTLTPAEVRQIIRDGAVDLGAVGLDSSFGFGRIDAINSLNLANPGCDDGLFCNGVEACVSSSCEPGTPPNCDDSDPCTDDSCNEDTDSCDHVHNTAPCDDGDACTLNDACSAGLCVGGAIDDCDDSNECTDDFCVSPTGCDHSPNTGTCDDGDPCTENDVCSMSVCDGDPVICPPDGNPCTDDACQSGQGCTYRPTDGSCDDGEVCTLNDFCSQGNCVSGPIDPCDDGDPCTDGVCVLTMGCDFTFNTAPCDDGDVCTLGDTCDSGNCLPGATIDPCDDGDPCTDDICIAFAGCSNPDNNAPCDDGDNCSIIDECSGGACLGVTFHCQLYGDTSPDSNGALPGGLVGNCVIDVDDVSCALDGFAGVAPCNVNADINPCPTPDGNINVDDIAAVLDSFAGIVPGGCAAACPPQP